MDQRRRIDDESPDTNVQATLAKLSAIHKQYYKDPYITQFVKNQEVKKDVIINRGYWLRHNIFTTFAQEFIQKHSISQDPVQIISLGCGFDTLYFRLLDQFENLIYIELDLPQVSQSKAAKINKSQILQQKIFEKQPSEQPQLINSKKYKLYSCDLTNQQLFEKILSQLSLTSPTLFIAECVLTYLPLKSSENLMRTMTKFTQSTFINYEMINMKDRFSNQMIKSFENQGYPLIGIISKEQQQQRMQEIGFKTIRIKTMEQAYRDIDKNERQRIEKLEPLDEIEEWALIQSHYTICIAEM